MSLHFHIASAVGTAVAVVQLAVPAATAARAQSFQADRASGAVVLTLASFTSARGGWAFAHPQRLRIVSGESPELELPAAGYEKLRVGLFDAGRREMLSFRIPAEQFVAMAAQSELELKAGKAKMRLGKREMGMLRDVVRRLSPASDRVR
jgi:hypothetical protein